MSTNDLLYKKYPWLRIITTIESYVDPMYYNKILKDYVFSGKTDLTIFSDFLEKYKKSNNLTILELGCGTGRVTDIFLKKIGEICKTLYLVDLSDQMLKYTKERFTKYQTIEYIQSDSVMFLKNDALVYDFIFSLWSFSHSVHQILTKDGLSNGRTYIKNVVQKMVLNNMNKDSYFYLVHFDSMSEEQKILLQQWKKVFPIFSDTNQQSPSKLLLDEVFEELEKERVISLEVKHLTGESIVYKNEDEALEVFMNFHMESYFNESPLLGEVIEDLTDYFKKYKHKDGSIQIKPGCFVYTVKKIM